MTVPSPSSLSKIFASCACTPRSLERSSESRWKGISFFLDSSGRSSFSLPLQLKFQSQDDIASVISAGCLDPFLKPEAKEEENQKEEEGDKSAEESGTVPTSQPKRGPTISFQVRKSPQSSDAADVEEVVIRGCETKDGMILIDTVITLRSTYTSQDPRAMIIDSGEENRKDGSAAAATIPLEITPVLIEQRYLSSGVSSLIDVISGDAALLMRPLRRTTRGNTRLSSIGVDVMVTHAFQIQVESRPGPQIGRTIVSLAIKHANTHGNDVQITNLSLHPGNSQVISDDGDKTAGGKYSVASMTKSVQWKYAPMTELGLPLLLKPFDAYATIIFIDASEVLQSRTFSSPISVTGLVNEQHRVVVAAQATWKSMLVAVEPADAFRVELSLKQDSLTCQLGRHVQVCVRVVNMSLEPADLMLFMGKDEESADGTINTATIAEDQGYTFGVWGISSSSDDGTARFSRDNDLLAVDAALLLGPVMGQNSVDEELRFVPLRKGVLKIPDWKLYDKLSGRWYACSHNLEIVAHAD